jgi:HEPN domain-containing protein
MCQEDALPWSFREADAAWERFVADEAISLSVARTRLSWYIWQVTVTVPADLIEKGRVLDDFYIPPRYPNSHPEGAPFEHYGPLQSEEAIRYASEIVGFVGAEMA